MVTLSELLANLPPEPNEASLFVEIQREVAGSKRKLVVIDDDATGTQTVHDIELFTTWHRQMLAEALQNEPRLFYLLTNSRSMPESDAVKLNHETDQQLAAASEETKIGFVVASRSDSTLRGHYPAEIQALESGFTSSGGDSFDGHLVVPAFFEGGRYTINDTHYVATPTANSDTLQPASETPFARDSVFGYKTAYLTAWIEAKSGGYWKADQVMSIGLDVIRQGGPEAVASKLQTVEGSIPVVINAAGYGDLAVVVLGLVRAEAAGKRFLYRTAASFVRLRGAVESKPPLEAKEIMRGTQSVEGGGVVVVGSYVPDSSTQLENVLTLSQVIGIELPVNTIELVQEARRRGVAIGAFNTYNLELTRAIVVAAEKYGQPIILQLGVQAIRAGGEPLAVATLAAARVARVPVAVHLDHCPDLGLIEACFAWGFSSALADGSHLPFAENIAFTKRAVELAARYGGTIESELGYLAGTEDGLTVEAIESSLTDPTQAHEFITTTGAAMLAVSIGNVHGYVPVSPPLDFERLAQIAAQVDVPLVLHGASGLSRVDIQHAIHMGIAKLNVNTEVRMAFLRAIAGWGVRIGPEPDPRKKGQDLLDLMQEAMAAAQGVVEQQP